MPLTRIITSYESEWPRRYDEEVERLRPLFGDALTEIHHVGSTAIPELSAKPEIDILADENREFVRAARAAGVTVEVGAWPGTVHGFLEAIGISRLSQRALSEQCRWLNTIMGDVMYARSRYRV